MVGRWRLCLGSRQLLKNKSVMTYSTEKTVIHRASREKARQIFKKLSQWSSRRTTKLMLKAYSTRHTTLLVMRLMITRRAGEGGEEVEEVEEAQEVEDPTESGGYEDNAPGNSEDGNDVAKGVSIDSGPSAESDAVSSNTGIDKDKTVTQADIDRQTAIEPITTTRKNVGRRSPINEGDSEDSLELTSSEWARKYNLPFMYGEPVEDDVF